MSLTIPRPIPQSLAELMARRLCLLGQPLRIQIIDHLEQRGDTTVQALADGLAAGQQNMSRHLGLLHRAGIVRRRQVGREAWYSLTDAGAYSLLEQVVSTFGAIALISQTGPGEARR